MASHNKFPEFPAHLCSLQTLEEVNLSHNEISDVTSEIRNIGNLIVLDLSNNKFEEFPYAVSYHLQIRKKNLPISMVT